MPGVLQTVVDHRRSRSLPVRRLLAGSVVVVGLSLTQPADAAEHTPATPAPTDVTRERSDGPGAAGLVVGVTLLVGWATTGAVLLRQGRRRRESSMQRARTGAGDA